MKKGLVFGGLIFLLLTVIVLVQSCGGESGNAGEQIETKPTSYLNLGSDAKYVGKEECRACHADKYDTFSKSELGKHLFEIIPPEYAYLVNHLREILKNNQPTLRTRLVSAIPYDKLGNATGLLNE